jgi:UDP-N-acetyl-D-glucosamine dehydrogenase
LLHSHNRHLNGAKILIVGAAYKKDVKDLRESPAIEIIETLQARGVNVSFYDPFLPYLKIHEIDLKRIEISSKSLKTFDCVIIVTDHTKVDYSFIKKHAKLIFDTRNVYKQGGKNIIRL